MNRTRRLKRLFTLARKGEVSRGPMPTATEEGVAAPVGFSTRVAALWAETPVPALASLWERVCWWGAAASIAICLAAGVHQSTLPEPAAFDAFIDAPVAEIEIF